MNNLYLVKNIESILLEYGIFFKYYLNPKMNISVQIYFISNIKMIPLGIYEENNIFFSLSFIPTLS